MKMSIVLFLFLLANISAQTTTLKFVDSETGKIVPSVIVQSNKFFARAKPEGYINLPASIIFEDTMTFKLRSYKTIVTTLRNYSGKTVADTIIIAMEPLILNIQSILIEGFLNQNKEASVAAQTISGKEIEKARINEDFPQLLQNIPSVTAYSEGGDGSGYNYLNIRGFDQRRILISVNGIPQNDPEDHNVYWIDFNDLAANSSYIQVQKGAGFALTGYPAIGGAINIITKSSAPKGVRTGLTLGSNNLRKYEISFSSGLSDLDFSVSGRVSKTLGTGYRDLSWINLGSYYLSVLKNFGGWLTQFNMYGGGVEDGLVYTGLPKFAVKNSSYRKLNYSYWEQKNGDFSYYTVRRPEERERFNQPHFELLTEYKMSEKVKFNAAVFMVLGQGYFDYDGSWAPFSYYRLTPANGFTVTGNPDDMYSNNALIRAQVENSQFGIVPRFEIKNDFGTLVTGAEIRLHNSVHWGALISGSNLPPEITPNYRYYYYEGKKDMFSAYVHQKFTTVDDYNFFAEAQVTYQKYRLYKEKYLGTDFSVPHLFFNPRVGVNYALSAGSSLYLSAASVAREPRLKNYYDAAEASGGETPQFALNQDGSYNFSDPVVKPERLFSLDAGYNFISEERSEFSLNFYYMTFKNEIVKQGQLDRFGVPITGNMPATRHIGAEIYLNTMITGAFRLNGSLSISSSKITNGTTYAKVKGKVIPVDLNGNTIAGFPGLLASLTPEYNFGVFSVSANLRYNGKFYSDNYGEKLNELNTLYPGLTKYPDNVNDAFFTVDMQLVTGAEFEKLTGSVIKLRVNNVFDNQYSQYAVGEEFFPAAGRTFLFSYSVKF